MDYKEQARRLINQAWQGDGQATQQVIDAYAEVDNTVVLAADDFNMQDEELVDNVAYGLKELAKKA